MTQRANDHPIAIAPNPNRIRVILGGAIIAETTRALTLKEGTYRPVQYIPREDAAFDLFEPSARRSHCPHKGDASYFTVMAGGIERRDCCWSYEAPFPAVGQIAGHLAFYPEKVDAIEELY